jgi:hypothetical protein
MLKPRVLLVSNFLSLQGASRTIAEELAQRLTQAGYQVLQTSALRARLHRLLDMLWTAYSRRADYQIAYVEVYSGAAFLWKPAGLCAALAGTRTAIAQVRQCSCCTVALSARSNVHLPG